MYKDSMSVSDQPNEKALTSDRRAALQDALELFYIKNNVSGRLRFVEEWPDVARYLLGDELMQFDREGTRDKARRAAFEDTAEDRRIALLDIVETVEKRSAKNGILRQDYIQDVVLKMGRATALHVYAAWIVDKFAPVPVGSAAALAELPQKPAIVETVDATAMFEDVVQAAGAMPDIPLQQDPPPVVRVLPNAQENAGSFGSMDDIRPISVDPQVAGEAETLPALPPSEPQQSTAPIPQQSAQPPRKKGVLKIFGIKDSSPPSE